MADQDSQIIRNDVTPTNGNSEHQATNVLGVPPANNPLMHEQDNTVRGHNLRLMNVAPSTSNLHIPGNLNPLRHPEQNEIHGEALSVSDMRQAALNQAIIEHTDPLLHWDGTYNNSPKRSLGAIAQWRTTTSCTVRR